ncbi:MAG: hypothetical protein H7321_06485 [Bacteroidia bacterium]|nr:hypothetical protein [Bacteroidia bacterium]
MKYIFFLLLFGSVIQANAQCRYKISALEVGARANNYYESGYSGLSTFQDNAKEPIQYSGYGYNVSSQGLHQFGSFGIYLHLSRFINDTVFNPNRKLRIGISASSAGHGISGFKDIGNYIDTFTKAGFNYYHSYTILSLDISTLRYGKIFWKRFRPFAGIGISPGMSLSSKGEFIADTVSHGRFMYNGTSYYYTSSSSAGKDYAVKPLVFVSAYIPIGLNFRLSKRLDLNLESRLNLNMYHVKSTTFNTCFSIMFSAAYKLF